MKITSFMDITRNGNLHAFLNAIVFSFIKSPAFFLFIIVLFIYGKGELTLGWINEGRRLTQDVPMGMVKTCFDNHISFDSVKYYKVSPNQSDKHGAAHDDVSGKYSVLCNRSIEPAVDYAKRLDRSIKHLYILIVIFSFGGWWVFTAGGKRIRHVQ